MRRTGNPANRQHPDRRAPSLETPRTSIPHCRHTAPRFPYNLIQPLPPRSPCSCIRVQTIRIPRSVKLKQPPGLRHDRKAVPPGRITRPCCFFREKTLRKQNASLPVFILKPPKSAPRLPPEACFLRRDSPLMPVISSLTVQ